MAKCSLSTFIHKSCAQTFSSAASQSSSELWPCPLPPSLELPHSRLVGRRKARWKLRHQCRQLTHQLVAACNWLALGRPRDPPADLPPSSAPQASMLHRLEGMVTTWVRLGHGPKRDLDRAVQKFETLGEQLAAVQQLCLELSSQLQPYNGCIKKASAQAGVFDSECQPASSSSPLPRVSGSASTSYKALDPDRLVFEQAPTFEADRFLVDPFLRAGFKDPRFFRRARTEWPPTVRARVQTSRDQQLRLYKRWDDVRSLHLLPASHSEFKYRCGLFSVYKSATVDRQILNPIPENSRTFSVSDATFSLAHASLLTQVFIPQGKNLVISSDDLKDFYHAFAVSEEHASRNHLRGVFDGADFEGWHAYKPELHGVPVVGCFKTLAMGTNFAVETAQHCHTVLLQRAGCLASHEQVCYKHPIPKGPGFDLLCIDDHVYLLLVDAWERCRQPSPNRRDIRLFRQAGDMYSKVHLRTSTKKAIRNAYTATVLGGQIDGVRGDIAAPRLKSTALSAITLQVVNLGWCTRTLLLLQQIIGCWMFVLLFRRPMLSILSQVYHEGSEHHGDEVFRLSHDCRQELLLLVILVPCAMSNLRAEPSTRLFCTDASPFAAGICSCNVPLHASSELLRFADHRGFYTALEPRLASYLDQFSSGQSEAEGEAVPRSLGEGILFDVCEISRGQGSLSHAAHLRGLRVHSGFSADDILQPHTMLAIIGLLCRRVIAYIHISIPFPSFGTMRRPRLRSRDAPWGFDPSEACTREGNLLATRVEQILHVAASYGALASAEQPLGSVLYALDSFGRLLTRGFFTVSFSCCSYGTPFRRPTRLIANNPALRELEGGCTCQLPDKHLRLGPTFDRESRQRFLLRCSPDSISVFGREPQIGESLSSFSDSCPLIVMQKVLDLQMPAIQSIESSSVGLRRPPFEPPRWIGDLGCCMHWKTLIQYRFKRLNHINVNEELAYRSLLKHVAKTSPGCRFGVLLDSRVTIGCNAKGRSSSASLNFFLSTSLPYILGGDLYPCLFHVGTGENCSDDPSRLRPLRAPTAVTPVWLQRFLAGDDRFLTAVRASDDFSGALGCWTRLSMPRRRSAAAGDRSRINLDVAGGLTKVVASRRESLFLEFERWVEDELHCSFQQVSSSGLLLGTALVGYGKAVFYSGGPKYVFSETLNAVVDRFKHFRPSFGAAWSILTRWEEEEPIERSMVMPEAVFRAAVAVALLWQWPHFAAALLLGFHGLLRPGELLSLRRKDLILPRDLLTAVPLAYVTILGSKTRRFLQRQHAKISDICTVKFLDALFGHLPGIVPLFGCSPAVFRRRWDLLFSRLGVPTAEDAKGITPKSLRGSGATWLYQMTEDVGRIQWRGRWQQRRTLEHYLQEVAGQLLLAELTESHRSRILQLAAFASQLLQSWIENLAFDRALFLFSLHCAQSSWLLALRACGFFFGSSPGKLRLTAQKRVCLSDRSACSFFGPPAATRIENLAFDRALFLFSLHCAQITGEGFHLVMAKDNRVPASLTRQTSLHCLSDFFPSHVVLKQVLISFEDVKEAKQEDEEADGAESSLRPRHRGAETETLQQLDC
ncbi:SUF4 [Symbiodinium sp. CCMP2592]|nr:SUF4 [Symbiodinium sp. CCMP2592]